MLKFVSISPNKTKDNHVKWFCQCDCGDVSEYVATRVRNGYKTQCTNCAKSLLKPSRLKHGMRNTGTYTTWRSMKNRCLNEKTKDFARYGGSGIELCQEWANSFEQFYLDMGERPRGCTIDRIDVTKGYFKENCRWATSSEQQRNRKDSKAWLVKGVVFQTLKEAANHFGVSPQTITKWVFGWHDKRINKTWSPKNDCRSINKY